jgi:hypothetical protein
MTRENIKRVGILLFLGLIGWGVCGGIIYVGRSITSMENTLIIHAIAVPIVFGILSYSYFRFLAYTTPLVAALAFLGIAFGLDFFIIAPFAEKSYDMFTSPQSILGTWISLGLIFWTLDKSANDTLSLEPELDFAHSSSIT